MVPSLTRLFLGSIFRWSFRMQQCLPLIFKQLYFCSFIWEDRVRNSFASTSVWSFSMTSHILLLTIASPSTLMSLLGTFVGAWCVFSSSSKAEQWVRMRTAVYVSHTTSVCDNQTTLLNIYVSLCFWQSLLLC